MLAGIPSSTIEGSVWEHYAQGPEIGSGNYATVFLGTAKDAARLHGVIARAEDPSSGAATPVGGMSRENSSTSTGSQQRGKRCRGDEVEDVDVAGKSKPQDLRVAVKISPRTDQTKVDVLRKEWIALSLARHPNIILAYEYFEDEKECSMVIEYAAEGTLMNWLNNHEGPIREREACAVVEQLLDAMAYLHQMAPAPSPTVPAPPAFPKRRPVLCSVVHRDIKPDNVLLVSLNPLVVRLADFGLVKCCGTGDWWARPNSAGDRAVMCPGLLDSMEEGKGVTTEQYQKGDVYSIGVCLYTMLSGTAPYPKDVDPRSQPDFPWIQPPSLKFPNFSGTAIETCRNLMKAEPEDRPTSMSAIAMHKAWASSIPSGFDSSAVDARAKRHENSSQPSTPMRNHNKNGSRSADENSSRAGSQGRSLPPFFAGMGGHPSESDCSEQTTPVPEPRALNASMTATPPPGFTFTVSLDSLNLPPLRLNIQGNSPQKK